MKNIVKEKPLIQNAFEILLKELGPEKTVRLWQVLGIFDKDYLKFRKKLFKGKSLDQLYKEAKRFNI
jgi:DNA polymerase/3'-5' exonuclease PolX